MSENKKRKKRKCVVNISLDFWMKKWKWKQKTEKVKMYGKRLCGRSRVKNLKAFLGHTLPLSSNGKHFSKKSVFVSIKLDQAWLDVVNILQFGSTNIILKGEISDWKSGGIDILRSLKDLEEIWRISNFLVRALESVTSITFWRIGR